MARYWSPAQRQRAKERAYAEWRERVLADPGKYSRLKVERYVAGLTQEQLAELPAVRMHPSSVGCIERGASKGNRNSLGRLGYALKLDPSKLSEKAA